MKKDEMIRKLQSFGVKNTKGKTVGELKIMLALAQQDVSKPGAYIGKVDISSAVGAKQPKG